MDVTRVLSRWLSCLLLAIAIVSPAAGQFPGGDIAGGSNGQLPLKLQPALWLDAAEGYCWTDAAASFVAADKSWLQVADASQTGLDLGTDDFLICEWFNPSTLGTQLLIDKFGGVDGYAIYVDGTSITGQFVESSTYSAISNSGVVAAGRWHFIAYYADRSGNLTIYVGTPSSAPVAVATIDISSRAGAECNSTVNFAVGSTSYSPGNFVNGSVDSLMIFKKADLSGVASDIITWAYNSGSGRLCSEITTAQKTAWGATSAWELGEPTGTRYDSWGSNHLSQAFSNIIQPPVYGDELLVNNTLDGWTGTDIDGWTFANAGSGSLTEETTLVHTTGAGVGALKITTGDNTSITAYQTKTNLAAGTYWLSFWTRGDGTNASRCGVYGATTGIIVNGVSSNVTGTNYTLVTATFALPSAQDCQILLYGDGDPGAVVYFDDISLKAITTAVINNGGFESWTIATDAASWTESVAGTSTITREDTEVYSGSHALAMQVDGSGSAAYAFQAVPTVGKLYSWSAAVKATPAAGSLMVGGNGDAVFAPTDSWVLYSGTTRPPSVAFLLAYNGSGAGTTFYFDSVTLTAAEILAGPGIVRGRSQDANFATQLTGANYYASSSTDFNFGTVDFSIAMAVYRDSTDALYLFGKGSAASTVAEAPGSVAFVNANGTVTTFFGSVDSETRVSTTSALTVPIGGWHTLVWTFNRDGVMTLYVDGVADANTLDISTLQGSASTTAGFAIGAYSLSDGTSFGTIGKGRFDNAFFAKGVVLNQTQVTWLHNSGEWRQWAELGQAGTDGAALTSSVVVGFYEFDDKIALGNDSTSNDNDLTPQGTPTQGKGINYYEGACSYWMDRSGNGRHASIATIAAYPAYTSVSAIGGRAAITFDGVDDYLGFAAALTGSTSDYTIFIVSDPYAATGTGQYYGGDGDLYLAHLTDASGKTGLYNNSAFTSVADATALPQILCYSLNSTGTAGKLYRNGSQLGSDFAYVAAVLSDSAKIGANNAGSGSFYNGDVAAMLVYPRVMPDAVRKAVTTWLQNHYAISP